ncbi:type II secretion system protein [Colwellia sp. RE-S-Sl-9]
MNTIKSNLLPSDNTGFTLIELVVVIVILGILSVTAFPKFINLTSDANTAIIKGAVGAIKSSVSLFKTKTITSRSSFEDVVEFSGVKGSNYQPWAAMATATSFSADYTSPPEIFEGAGLNVNDWAYRIYVLNGSYAVAAAPRNVLSKDQPTQDEVKATNCYFEYHWKALGEPVLTTVNTGC